MVQAAMTASQNIQNLNHKICIWTSEKAIETPIWKRLIQWAIKASIKDRRKIGKTTIIRVHLEIPWTEEERWTEEEKEIDIILQAIAANITPKDFSLRYVFRKLELGTR